MTVQESSRPAGVGEPIPWWGGPGWIHLVEALPGTAPPDGWAAFRASWERLPADDYLSDSGHYRRRRYSRFHRVGDRIRVAPHGSFFQSRAVNPVNGGRARVFAPVEVEVAASTALCELVLALEAALPVGDWEYGVHQIRTTIDGGAGRPAPEGIHRDGHHYVGQVLIDRSGVEGGRSTVYDAARSPLHDVTLTRPLEALVVNDRRVMHGVSDIRAQGPGPAHRDMLLVDFSPCRPGAVSRTVTGAGAPERSTP